MIIDVKPLHFENAVFPIVSSCEPDANITDVKPELLNAFSPIDVTDAGIVIEVKLLQY